MNGLASEDVGGEHIRQEQKAFSAFLKITENWQLTTEQQVTLLGAPARSTFFKWKKEGAQLPGDTLERISHIMSIHKCLTILFTDSARADQWIRRPNEFWGKQSALDHMLGGRMADIIDVRNYLDAQRGS